MNTGHLSHDIQYRISCVIPNGGELISWQHIGAHVVLVQKPTHAVEMYREGQIEVIYKYQGETRRTSFRCKKPYKRIYK